MSRGVILDPLTGRPEGEDVDRLAIVRNLGLVEEAAALEAIGWKPRLARLMREQQIRAADGNYYVDARPPFITAAQTAITLATTDKLAYPGFITALPANYFWPGKRLRLTVMGTITTGTTPGNIGVELYYGTADAATTLLASSAALALIASQTTIPFRVEAYVQCRAVGSGTNGSLFAWGIAKFGTAVIANPNDHFFVPASAPASIGVDTTATTGGFGVQIKRTGSTAESVTVQDIIFEALN